jgi:hypothetical protein
MKDPIFKTNPKLENYFKTADGNAFFTEHDAKNHATSLKSKKVEKVERPFVKEKVKETPAVPPVKSEKKKEGAKNKKQTPVKKDEGEPVKDDTNVDNASYAELMLFVTDNEIELSSKKAEDVRSAIKAYLANPNKEIVPFKGDLN